MNAYLLLANGMVFAGQSVGAQGVTVGEVVFSTGMVGFQETLTDPSYYGQIITQTYPLIGNYGMNSEDTESGKIWAKGYIVREACKTPSNFRSEETLDSFLKKNGIIGIEGIDTRSLTRTLRESGVMNGAITTEFDPDAEPEKKAALLPEIAAYAVVDAVKTVTCREAVTYEPTAAGAWGDTPLHVALLDLGCKNNIVRCLQKRGCRVTVLPGTTTAAELAAAVFEASHHDWRILIEQGIDAREIECAVLCPKAGSEPQASWPGEIVLDKRNSGDDQFYDFDSKYMDSSASHVEVPANLPQETLQQVRETAVKAFKAVDGAGLSRVDTFVTPDGEVMVNEINTMPGFTPISMYPKAWEATGIGYTDLITKLIDGVLR